MGIDAEMFVRTKTPPSERKLRWLSYELCAAFGHEQFMISPPGGPYTYGHSHHALEFVDKWEQDGPDIDPKPGEAFIKCHIWTRYYGPRYERGDVALIIAVARWLEMRIDGATVWYGGDSSGVCAAPFGQKQRERLWRHFVDNGHAPYTHHARLGRDSSSVVCSYCADATMAECMWGGGKTGYLCLGCGLYRLVHNDGSTVDTYNGWDGDEKAVRAKPPPPVETAEERNG